MQVRLCKKAVVSCADARRRSQHDVVVHCLEWSRLLAYRQPRAIPMPLDSQLQLMRLQTCAAEKRSPPVDEPSRALFICSEQPEQLEITSRCKQRALFDSPRVVARTASSKKSGHLSTSPVGFFLTVSRYNASVPGCWDGGSRRH